MPKSSKLSLKNLFLGIAALGLGALIPMNISVTLSESLNHRVFFLQRVYCAENISVGDYVLFRIKPSPYVNIALLPSDRIMKRVACLGGDVLNAANGQYYCNGRFLGQSKSVTLAGKPVSAFLWSGPVPGDMLFVMGDHKDSFDSRYFGFVERGEVIALAWPLY